MYDLVTWSPGQPEQMGYDMALDNSMVTLKVLFSFVGTILGNYFVGFNPLMLSTNSLLKLQFGIMVCPFCINAKGIGRAYITLTNTLCRWSKVSSLQEGTVA